MSEFLDQIESRVAVIIVVMIYVVIVAGFAIDWLFDLFDEVEW